MSLAPVDPKLQPFARTTHWVTCDHPGCSAVIRIKEFRTKQWRKVFGADAERHYCPHHAPGKAARR